MKVYIVRHGDAVTTDVNPDRPLSEKGRQEVARIAHFIQPRKISLEHIWYSTKLRAQQTAEILTGSINSLNGSSARVGLGPNDIVQNIADELEAYNSDLMIVGHLPFVGKLVSLLATGKETANLINYTSGVMVCLDRQNPGKWQIDWIITPSMFR